MTITPETIRAFAELLRREERSAGTVENYLRHVRAFCAWLDGKPVTKEAASAWKSCLVQKGYRPGTVNAMLVPLNQLFKFLGCEDCRVKALRVQRQMFRDDSRELTREEYARLLAAAGRLRQERLGLLMEATPPSGEEALALCSTGIRVSEVQYLTVEAARAGRAEVSLKGKIRTILIPQRLRKKLLQYAKKQKTASGEIFRTRRGSPISRKQIWAEMKALCAKAGVAASKVFPHNLRHLFARVFYSACRDVAKLADVLGHSSLETTRIYLISSGAEHARQLERLHLII